MVAAPTTAGATPPDTAAWATTYSLPGGHYLTDVACPTSTECFATAQTLADTEAVFRTTDFGATWTQSLALSGYWGIGDLACPTTTFCMVEAFTGDAAVGAGEMFVTSDAGTSWQHVASLGSPSGVSLLGCASASTCYADDGQSLLQTTDGGTSWRALTTAAPYVFRATCPSATTCYFAASDGIYKTTDDGTTFTKVATLTGVDELDCVSTSACVADSYGSTEGGFLETTDGGVSWTLGQLPAGFSVPLALSCTSATTCTVVSRSRSAVVRAASTQDGGTTWGVADVAPVSGPFGTDEIGLACVGTDECALAGAGLSADSVYLETGTEGTWGSSEVAASSAPPIQALACVGVSRCVGLGPGSAVVSTDDGSSWAPARHAPAGFTTYHGIDCPRVTRCVAVGATPYSARGPATGSSSRSVDGGATWQSPATNSVLPFLFAVACPTASTCLATTDVAGELLRSTNDGSTWQREKAPSSVQLQAVTCGSALVCAAAGYNQQTDAPVVLQSTDGGVIWTPRATNGLTGPVYALTCVTASACWAATVDGTKMAIERSPDGGRTWHVGHLAASTDGNAQPGQGAEIACGTGQCAALLEFYDAESGFQSSTLVAMNGPGQPWSSVPLPSGVDLLQSLSAAPGGWFVASGMNVGGGPVILRGP